MKHQHPHRQETKIDIKTDIVAIQKDELDDNFIISCSLAYYNVDGAVSYQMLCIYTMNYVQLNYLIRGSIERDIEGRIFLEIEVSTPNK